MVDADGLGKAEVSGVAEHGDAGCFAIQEAVHGNPTGMRVIALDPTKTITGEKLAVTRWIRFKRGPQVVATRGHAAVVIFVEYKRIVRCQALLAFNVKEEVFVGSRMGGDSPGFMEDDRFPFPDRSDVVQQNGERSGALRRAHG